MGINSIASVGTMNMNSIPKQTKVVESPELTVTPVAVSPQERVAPVAAQSGGANSQSQREDKEEVMKDKEVSPEKVKSAVEDINKQIRSTRCSFKYHEETNRISITVIDKDTDEVIKEIPPEKTLDMIAKAWELAGLMVDERR